MLQVGLCSEGVADGLRMTLGRRILSFPGENGWIPGPVQTGSGPGQGCLQDAMLLDSGVGSRFFQVDDVSFRATCCHGQVSSAWLPRGYDSRARPSEIWNGARWIALRHVVPASRRDQSGRCGRVNAGTVSVSKLGRPAVCHAMLAEQIPLTKKSSP